MPKGYPKNGTNKGWIKKGARLSLETRKKISIGHKGINTWTKGTKASDITRAKMSEAHKRLESGKRLKKQFGNKTKVGWGKKPGAEEIKKKMSLAMSGEKNPSWRGGITNYERKLYLNGRRRVLRLEARGFHTQKEWQTLKEICNFTCLACRKREPDITLTEDHIIPLSKGGSDDIGNIQPLCRSCNCKKHAKIIIYEQ